MGVVKVIEIGHKSRTALDLTARGVLEQALVCLPSFGYTVEFKDPVALPTPPSKRRKKC